MDSDNFPSLVVVGLGRRPGRRVADPLSVIAGQRLRRRIAQIDHAVAVASVRSRRAMVACTSEPQP